MEETHSANYGEGPAAPTLSPGAPLSPSLPVLTNPTNSPSPVFGGGYGGFINTSMIDDIIGHWRWIQTPAPLPSWEFSVWG